MEVTSKAWREWGTVGWLLAFGALALMGVPDAGMSHWMHKKTEPGPRSSTDSMIARTVHLPDGTAKLRELLAGTAPPAPGQTWVIRSKWSDQYEEVAIAISLLAWPDRVNFLVWDDKRRVPTVPGRGKPARYFFLGHAPKDEIPGLQQVSDTMWFKPGTVPP